MRIQFAVAMLIVTIAGTAARADHLYPGQQWPIAASPEAENCSSAGLAAYESWLTARVGTKPYGTIVIRHGKVVYEKYGQAGSGLTIDVGSIRKSIASGLIGIAIDENRIDASTIVYNRWPTIYSLTNQQKDRSIQLRHLAAMQSGWFDTVGPGVKWLYHNAGSTAAGAVIGATYANEYSSRWPRYGNGRDYIAPMVEDRIRDVIGANWRCTHASANFAPLTYHPGPKLIVESTLSDIARYGYLWLRDGQWGNSQLISRRYVREATTNQSGSLGGNYGYFWFTNQNRGTLPAAPADAYWHCGDGADGHRTMLLVVPSLDLVAACTTHKDDFDLTNRFTARPSGGPAQWAAALLPAILPDPKGTTKPTFVSEYFRDGTTGAFDPVFGWEDLTATAAGLEFDGGPTVMRLTGRTYTDQTAILSVAAGMPRGAWAGVLLRGAATNAHLNDGDPHVWIIANRRATDGASVVEVRQGTTLLSSRVVQQTNFALSSFLMRIVTAGSRLQVWVNGERCADIANAPNPPGGGHVFLDARVDPNHPGIVRVHHFVTRASTDGVVDVSFDDRNFVHLTLLADGPLAPVSSQTFALEVNGFRMNWDAFWQNVFRLPMTNWSAVSATPEHAAIALEVRFPPGMAFKFDYLADSELEYLPH